MAHSRSRGTPPRHQSHPQRASRRRYKSRKKAAKAQRRKAITRRAPRRRTSRPRPSPRKPSSCTTAAAATLAACRGFAIRSRAFRIIVSSLQMDGARCLPTRRSAHGTQGFHHGAGNVTLTHGRSARALRAIPTRSRSQMTQWLRWPNICCPSCASMG